MDVIIKHNFKMKQVMAVSDVSVLLDRLGQETIRRVMDRTVSQHVDADGKAFKEYSPAYARYRERKGRSTAPNLTFTGRMMATVRRGVQSKTADQIEIGVSGDEVDKATHVEAGGREFLGVNKEDVESLERIAADWAEEQLRDL